MNGWIFLVLKPTFQPLQIKKLGRRSFPFWDFAHFQEAFAVSSRYHPWYSIDDQTCSNGFGLSMVACNATICLPILGAWVLHRNFAFPKAQSETDGAYPSTHQLIENWKKITSKSLKSKLQWPHRRRSLAWLSSMRLGHHQWCRIQNSLQPQGPPDLTQGIPCHDGVVCLSHKKRLHKKTSKSWVMAPKRKAQRSDSPGNDETEESSAKKIRPRILEQWPSIFDAWWFLRNCHFIEKKICYQISAYESIL